MISADLIARIRHHTLSLTGFACLAYALAALALGRPDPAPIWIPGALGVFAALAITAAFAWAPKAQAAMADDELTQAQVARALRIGYWVAVFLYPIFGLMQFAGLVDWPTAFAAMGTLTGAA
ncbi:MAG: hypothetical protein AAFU61_17210, partial [Pseudomonadota bacterium]